MSARRFSLVIAVMLLAAACSDFVAPQPTAVERPQFETIKGDAPTHILAQSPGAPALETYQVSFWVHRNAVRDVSVIVNYVPTAGQSVGQPFLYFYVPKDALLKGGGGSALGGRDSVFMTLTIDPATFLVDFEPSGVVFDNRHPAVLVLWYENADPDLNGDGTVDGTDRALAEQLRIVYRSDPRAHWHKTRSMRGWTYPYVVGALRHFSQYAVSW